MQSDLDLADHLSGTPTPTIWSKWFGGVIAPVLLMRYGIKCCVLQQAELIGRDGSEFELGGKQAVAMGVAWICLSLFLHFHYYWPTLKRFYVFIDLGKRVFAFGFIISLGYVLWAIVQSWI